MIRDRIRTWIKKLKYAIRRWFRRVFRNPYSKTYSKMYQMGDLHIGNNPLMPATNDDGVWNMYGILDPIRLGSFLEGDEK